MKKALLLLFVLTALNTTLSFAQTCVRDSSILQADSFQLLSPKPWSPDSPFFNLALACINEPYNQSVTINVPTTYVLFGFSVPIVNVSIPTTNGVGDIPAGMTYLCDPPNCVFPGGTLGCILLYGTPDASNPAPDTADLSLTATVLTSLGPAQVTFPGDPSAPDDHYYLIVNPTGQCQSSSVDDPGSPFSGLRAMPNPVSQMTTIDVYSTQTGSFQFEVFNLLGKRVHAETVQLFEGANQFAFDAANLPAGAYLYALGNRAGRSVRQLIKL